MTNHDGLLTIDWATRAFHYDGIRGLSDDELSSDEVLARIEQHEARSQPDTEVHAIAFMETDTIIDDRGVVRRMVQLEIYSAAELREALGVPPKT